MSKGKKIFFIMLCLFVLIIANILFFFRGEIEDHVQQIIYERADKSFDFDITESSWNSYSQPFEEKESTTSWEEYCSNNCRKSNVYCRNGATEPCYSGSSCESDNWSFKVSSSADLLCNYYVGEFDAEKAVFEENQARPIAKGIAEARYYSSLSLLNNSPITLCCVSQNYPEKVLCKSSILMAKCNEPSGKCNDKICNHEIETCKNCPEDCSICEQKPKTYSYVACILGEGDLVYNENKVILQENLYEVERFHNDKRPTFNCYDFDLSINDEIVFRMSKDSIGLLLEYDGDYENNLGKEKNYFLNEQSAFNMKCTFLGPGKSFNCENVRLF